MKRAALLVLVLVLGVAQVQPPGWPPVQSALPQGWAAGLDREVGGIKPLMMNVWEGAPPHGVEGAAAEFDDGTGRVRSVSRPGMLIYLPPAEKAKAAGGACIIACVGGGYTHLTRLVGADYAVEPLTRRGIAVVALKYRVKPGSTDPERDGAMDAKQAVRLVRAHAAEWNIDPKKVGMLGWSAGGNLILSMATHPDGAREGPATRPFDRLMSISSRPDFVVMWSPWPNGKTIDAYPGVKDLPPALVGTARDDRTAPATFAEGIRATWEKAGAEVTYVDVEAGGHGAFTLGTGSRGDWLERDLLRWMEKRGVWKGGN